AGIRNGYFLREGRGHEVAQDQQSQNKWVDDLNGCCHCLELSCSLLPGHCLGQTRRAPSIRMPCSAEFIVCLRPRSSNSDSHSPPKAGQHNGTKEQVAIKPVTG